MRVAVLSGVALVAALLGARAIVAPAIPARDANPNALATVDAEARAAGNRRAVAVRIGEALLARTWSAQIVKIRVDGAGGHNVAGIVLSGVKFHQRLGPSAFSDEVIALVAGAFAASDVDEVDVWATIPLPVTAQEVESGEYLRPTARIVYAATVERSEASSFAGRLRTGDDVFWDPAWRRSLGAS
jgi:hypothetical protein